MPFSIIVSMDLHSGIGINNKLPWHIPADLKWFKTHTLNKTVVMGSNTYFSLPEKYRPLSDRKNVVLTNNPDKKILIESEGALVRSSIQEILTEFKDDDCFIIGGANLFDQMIDHVNYLYITKVAGNYTCDTFFKHFPKEEELEWSKYEDTSYRESDFYVYKFLIFKRIVDFNDLDFMYSFYTRTTDDIKVVDKEIFPRTKEYKKTIEDIKVYLRTNKLQKITKMINETKSRN